MVFSMLDSDAIILGGKNGYGKTTVFDALELVLTGEIERYRRYEESFFDHRRNPNTVEMPLVYDKSVPEVSVAADVSYEEGGNDYVVTLIREAKVEEMKNPVNFSAFQKLYVCREGEERYIITDEERVSMGLDRFAKSYGTLSYLSQEESTFFVKSSDSLRAETIQYLFNTKRFDDRIDKVEKLITKGVKRYHEELISERKELTARIEDLKKYQVDSNGDDAEYVTLFREGAHIKWDMPEVRLSKEEYFSLLKDHGIIDGLLYFAKNQEDVRKYRKSLFLNELLEKSSEFTLYWQYRGSQTEIKLWKDFQIKTVEPILSLELAGIEQFELRIPEGLEQVILSDKRNAAINTIDQVKSLYRSSSQLERAYNEMISLRNRLHDHLRSHAEQLSLTICPLCGNSYDNVKNLLASLEQTLNAQHENARVFSTAAVRAFEMMKEQLVETVIGPGAAWFNEHGINDDVANSYQSLNDKYLETQLVLLIKKGYIKENPEESIEATEAVFRKAIEDKREVFNEDLDYQWLTEVYNNYGKLILPDSCHEDVIMRKRAYLSWLAGKQQSIMMTDLTSKMQELDLKLTACERKIVSLKRLRNELERQKNQWLMQVITDVEILFYIYSGRIMQDNFFGRGLFMKNEPGKYVSFVSDPKSEVDALYKLSSGQLVALMMSLLLSLNKLYATEKFIAIDDPVQTIDDINVWGFVDTLRHEFRDYQLLFSTHELSYGSFLRYKLSRMGICAEYRDMMTERRIKE